MSARRTAKARMRAAQHELDAAQTALQRDLAPLRAWVRRHRRACILAGGFLSGFALEALLPRSWSRVRSAFGGSAASLARSFLMPILASAIVSWQQQATAGSADAAPDASAADSGDSTRDAEPTS